MSMKLKVALLVVFVVGVGFGIRWQRQAAERMRVEIASRVNASGELERLRQENVRLAKERISPAELERLRADHAAVARLRLEIEDLKATPLPAEAPPARRVENPVPTAAKELEMIPASEWKNAGRATPRATVETAAWAAAGGDMDALVPMIAFGPEALQRAQTLFGSLAPAMQAEHGSPERLIALLSARDIPLGAMQVLAVEAKSEDDTRVELRMDSGRGVRRLNLDLRRFPDGWRLVVPPEAVDKYTTLLKGSGAKE